MNLKLFLRTKQALADTLTPVSIYLKLRDLIAGSLLLESTDYHGRENSVSFICSDPIAELCVQNERIETKYPGQSASSQVITSASQVHKALNDFRQSFSVEGEGVNLSTSGLFGYMAYDVSRYFDNPSIAVGESKIPDLLYHVYRYVIRIDHFSNEMTICEYQPEGASESGLEKIEKIIFGNRFSVFDFSTDGLEIGNMSEVEFLDLVELGKRHCLRGDVFQIVLSRKYMRAFKGDEFNVYRALRSINPSPYLFYIDCGRFRIFGSSPETQLRVRNGYASIYPIAGTFKRSGNDAEDAELATELQKDEKESAEHLMLVDLARNDLSRGADEVCVKSFKEIQYYSHVIHMVSEVSGRLRKGVSPVEMVVNTFPAGTLSGAPKHRAMKLIGEYEKINRGFYGGAIGYLGFNGDFNHAIMIRTFLSMDNTLTYQAGAGVVAKSIASNELQEVNNKLEALRKAITLAEAL